MEEFKIKEIHYDENKDLIITTEDGKVFKFICPESGETDTKKKRKRYRYIASGECHISDPISDFRLLSKQALSDVNDHCIRIELPDYIKLTKYEWNDYSTTKSNIKIGNLNPKAMYLSYGDWIIDEDLTEMWKKGKIQPCNFYVYIKEKLKNRED